MMETVLVCFIDAEYNQNVEVVRYEMYRLLRNITNIPPESTNRLGETGFLRRFAEGGPSTFGSLLPSFVS